MSELPIIIKILCSLIGFIIGFLFGMWIYNKLNKENKNEN